MWTSQRPKDPSLLDLSANCSDGKRRDSLNANDEADLQASRQMRLHHKPPEESSSLSQRTTTLATGVLTVAGP